MDTAWTSDRAGAGTDPPSIRRLVWWVAPDLALILSLAVLLCLFVVFDATRGFFRDSDAGWHIRTGEAILNGNGLPRTDSYSLLKGGEPWFAWEWGSDVLMGFCHERGGLAAVAVLFATAVAGSIWLWVHLNVAMGGHFLIAIAFMPLVLTMTQIHWHARPHVLSWLFILGAIWYAEQPRRHLSVVALASALWANVHASFFIAVVICLIYAAARYLRPVIWEAKSRIEDWRDARWFAVAALVSAVSTLANPYGWEVHRHVIRYFGDTELLSRISEFQSFDYSEGGAAAMLLGLTVTAIGGVLSFAQRRPERALVTLFFFSIAVRSARGLPIAALVCLPIANAAITTGLRGASGLLPSVRRRIIGFLTYGDNFNHLDARFAGLFTAFVAVASLVVIVQAPAVASRAGFSEKTLPVSAANHLAALPREMRLLATDQYGGYLIYRFNGAIKVYFDGRSDFYGSQYLKNYLELIQLRPGWREKVAKVGFTHALLPKGYSLITALEEIGWKRLYADDVAVILQAPPSTPGAGNQRKP